MYVYVWRMLICLFVVQMTLWDIRTPMHAHTCTHNHIREYMNIFIQQHHTCAHPIAWCFPFNVFHFTLYLFTLFKEMNVEPFSCVYKYIKKCCVHVHVFINLQIFMPALSLSRAKQPKGDKLCAVSDKSFTVICESSAINTLDECQCWPFTLLMNSRLC